MTGIGRLVMKDWDWGTGKGITGIVGLVMEGLGLWDW